MNHLFALILILNSLSDISESRSLSYSFGGSQHRNQQIFKNDPVFSPYNSYYRPYRQYKPSYNSGQSAQTYGNLELDSNDDYRESTETNKTQQQITTEPIPESTTYSNDDQLLKAVAVLRGKASGTINFEQIGDKVRVTGNIEGLSNGLHAFHIHDYGDLRRSCDSAGGHFNPYKTKHGSPFDSVRHVGDLGNVFANEAGAAKINIEDSFLSLKNGKNNILGHAIIVHENVDDLGRGGHVKAGRRIGCGIIGWLNELA